LPKSFPKIFLSAHAKVHFRFPVAPNKRRNLIKGVKKNRKKSTEKCFGKKYYFIHVLKNYGYRITLFNQLKPLYGMRIVSVYDFA
jgi:hypothetical protein